MSSSSLSSHLMKTTRRGRPFVKDTHDLFATLIVSLQLESHRQFFKSYPNSFNTDEASANLASLKFSQSNRAADPKDPTRIITTTTTTTFSMSREMAKGICQHFMDAHLIENAADLTSDTFKDRGVYMITPKGLHILERFITKNGISAEHLLKVFATQPICMKLLHLERRSQDDEILITKGVIEVLFKRFAGREPNVTKLNEDEILQQYSARPHSKGPALPPSQELDRTLGIVVRKATTVERTASDTSNDEYIFSAIAAANWLCDFTTITGRDEAAEIAAHFVRYGLITLVSDRKSKENAMTVSVRAGGPGGGAGAKFTESEFRCTDKAVYKITTEGAHMARWNEQRVVPGVNASSRNLTTATVHSAPRNSDSIDNPTASLSSTTDAKLSRRPSISDRLRADFLDANSPNSQHKDSHTARLKQILEEPALRSLFREFLRSNFCEENLSFWLDVQDFKRRFNTTSSAVGSGAVTSKNARTHGHAAMEKHQQDLIAMAFVIYNTYLAPASPCELNIDHNLRAELVTYMTNILSETSSRDGLANGSLDPSSALGTLQASQLQTMVRLYERIQGYIFRLMATDSVPKFCKTERFLALMRSAADYNGNTQEHDVVASSLAAQANTLHVSEKAASLDVLPASPTRAYVTISQAANEKQAAMSKQSSH